MFFFRSWCILWIFQYFGDPWRFIKSVQYCDYLNILNSKLVPLGFFPKWCNTLIFPIFWSPWLFSKLVQYLEDTLWSYQISSSLWLNVSKVWMRGIFELWRQEQDVFLSIVSSMNLGQRRESHTVHLFDFSSLCVFKCVLKWPAWENA